MAIAGDGDGSRALDLFEGRHGESGELGDCGCPAVVSAKDVCLVVAADYYELFAMPAAAALSSSALFPLRIGRCTFHGTGPAVCYKARSMMSKMRQDRGASALSGVVVSNAQMARQEKAMLELVDFRCAVPTPETKFPISGRKRWGPRRQNLVDARTNGTESYLSYMEPGFKGNLLCTQ
jgi:hypothetical protein